MKRDFEHIIRGMLNKQISDLQCLFYVRGMHFQIHDWTDAQIEDNVNKVLKTEETINLILDILFKYYEGDERNENNQSKN